MAQATNKIITPRFLPALAVCLLGCTALSGSAQAGWFDFGSDKAPVIKAVESKSDVAKPAGDLEGSIRQAQMLRASGDYAGAIQHLSQLMLVAADDSRVVSEYGKTLAAQGHAQEALNFLTRAQQLQGNDWTVYNALGVTYDELDKQNDARAAYEHALALKPGDTAVLSNYALSRLMAKDPETAKMLMARAQSAGGAADPQIARNIALIASLTTGGDAADVASTAPAAPRSMAMASPAPRTPVSSQPMPRVAQSQPFVNIPAPPVSAPRMLQPTANEGVIQAQPQMMAAAQVQPSGVVMQRVPYDPLAGPVISATHAPHALTKPAAKMAMKTEPKPAAAQSQAQSLQEKAEAIAKTLNGKPAAIARAKAEAEKPAPALPKAVARLDMSKSAEAKAVPVKAVAKKDAIPALRMSANAY